jgi:hypothetical protein
MRGGGILWGGGQPAGLAAAMRARPFPLHVMKALTSKWYYMKFVRPIWCRDNWVMGLSWRIRIRWYGKVGKGGRE